VTAGRPTAASQVRLVASREVRERTRSRSFRVGTVVVAAIAALLVVLPDVLPGGDDPEWTVAVVGEAPGGLAEALDAAAASASAEVTLTGGDDAPPEALLEDGDVDAVLVDGTSLVVDGRDDQLEAVLRGAVAQARFEERLAGLGVDPQEAAGLTGAPLEVRDLDGDGDGDSSDREAMAFVGVVALFVALATYGNWVLTSVLEEKANRIVEVVLSAVSPRRLLAGKVLGTGVVALSQVLVVAAVLLVVAAATGALPDLPDSAGATAAALALWFVLGFAFYAVGYAAAGALVSRQEEAQSAATPMISIVMVAYFASLSLVVPNPDSAVARVVSLLPPVAPLAMPARIAAGEAAVWEVALAVVLMVVAIWLMVVLAARIYTNALLRTGARVPVREALRRNRVEPTSPTP
jgi:ABC-2 type transport system permease protein